MTLRFRTRLAASIAAASLAIVGSVAIAPAANAAPDGSDLDYPSYAYPGLRAGSVITPVTFERFERLLNTDGTYAFLIGGPADATTSAAVTHIDAVAQQYGVDTIYTFDPRLDGAELDIRTTGIADLSALWTRVVENNLNRDTTPSFGGDPSDDPYLFVYNRARTSGGAEDRIISQLGGVVDASVVSTTDGSNTYRAQVAAVFGAAATNGRLTVSTQSQFDFFRDAFNGKHRSQYIDVPNTTEADREQRGREYGNEILTEADRDGFRVRQLSYPELIQVLDTPGDHVILFGGTWCHNTRAVIKDINRAAKAAGTKTVYLFDLRLDGSSANDLHIRDTASDIAYLYGDLVAKYFPNLRTQYVTNGSAGQRVDYHPGGDTSVAKVAAKKLQVPYLIEYNKANAAAPIVQDWIRDNGNGTFTEYMTEWWWVAGLTGRQGNQPADQFAAAQQRGWTFAKEAIAKVDGFFGLATAPAAPLAPTVSLSGQDATVTWTAPANGGSALTSFLVSLDSGAPVTVPGDATSHTFTEVPSGQHTVTVTAVNYIGVSPASAVTDFAVAVPTASPTPTPTATPTPTSTPTLPAAGAAEVTVSGELRPGGTITVTGSGLPASTPDVVVEIRSTPQTLGTVTTTTNGGFELRTTIPSSIAAGAHTVVVLIDGQVVASAAVTISGALPATGGAVPFLVVSAAVALIAAGTAVVVVRRRREADLA